MLLEQQDSKPKAYSLSNVSDSVMVTTLNMGCPLISVLLAKRRAVLSCLLLAIDAALVCCRHKRTMI